MNDRHWINLARQGSFLKDMMAHRRQYVLLLGAVSLAIAVNGSLRANDANRSAAKPVNLRVLPKESSAADIQELMERYNADLGVQCEYCHNRSVTTQQLDYAADDNPAKQTARVMIAMLNEINTKYLAQLDDQKYAVLVSCGNCHRGRSDPPEFEPTVRAVADLKSRRQ